jgi:hypothetical protein
MNHLILKMLTIENAIDFLLSSESDKVQIQKTHILKNRSILSIQEIKNIKNNIVECFIFYVKNKLTNYDTNIHNIYDSFLKFLKLKIMEKNFIKKLNPNFPFNKQLYLKSNINNLNDCFGILFLSIFFNINVVISVKDKNYILTDGSDIDKYKPYIILVYYQEENIFLPTFEFGNKEFTFNHEEFNKIILDDNTNIVNVNLRNANRNIINLQEKTKEKLNVQLSSESFSEDSDVSDEELDDEVKNLISKTDAQLLKERKEILLTVIGRLKLYQKGYEKKKKSDLVSIIRKYK